MFTKFILPAVCLLFFCSCNRKPQAIDYGKAHCHFCEMTIVDQNHASFYMTKKGKQFNFDSIECMINELKSQDEKSIAVIQVTHFGFPNQFIEAKTSSYLVSSAIKSPMGENLSAFSSLAEAQKMQVENGGELFTWQQIIEKIKN